MIPQTDPKAGYLAQRAEIDAAIARVLEGGRYILGPEVSAFEREFSAYIGVRHGVGVGSGTDALVLALKAIGVAPEDYVVTVSHTAVASVAAIELAGARPLLVDIEPRTFTMDPAELARVLAAPPGRIPAIVPVHLYGQPADLDAILPLARRHGARVVEDCAQSHGARLGESRAGSLGDLAAFSFYPTKNLGALGDGGMVATADAALAERLRALREYGWRERYVSDIAGANSRLDELQAAVLRVKLGRLEARNSRRAALAAAYDRGLAGLALGLPARRAGAGHVFHQYVVR
jgi:dTDP-4-amino-4,6-dideoxygalactose transaminase